MVSNNIQYNNRHYFLSSKLLGFILLAIFGLLVSPAYAVDIQVSIDRTQIQVNETFTLTFEANEDPDNDPDFSPLEKDFQVLNQSTSSNISIVNGKYTKSKRWSVSLMATREGTITVPSISFGSDSSPQYQLTIKPVQKSSGKAGADFMSELDIDIDTAYPQSQIIVTQRLLSSKNINGYEFSQLKTDGVEVVKQALGEIRQYQTKRGEKPYLVLEQSFALFPQSDGVLTIQPSVATARLTLNNRSNYDPFRSNTKTVRRASEKKSITVKPVPPAFKGGHWLPAKEVQLVEEFPENIEFKIGEPITRTLSLLVDGQSASQLPELTQTEINGLKQYPDKALLDDTIREDGIIGKQQIKVALIPSSAGTYTLPAMSVNWWNIKTGKQETASIPERKFSIASDAATNIANKPVTTPENTNKTELTNTPASTKLQTSTTTVTVEENNLTWIIISALLAIGWLITALMLWNLKRKQLTPKQQEQKKQASLKQAYKMLTVACQKNDAQLCKNALLEWNQALLNDKAAYSLGNLITKVDTDLGQQISLLNEALYNPNTEQWNCENLITLCQSFEKKISNMKTSNSDTDQLEPLYR